jgi:glycosyltransferase involved in cell wall biosynthesis
MVLMPIGFVPTDFVQLFGAIFKLLMPKFHMPKLLIATTIPETIYAFLLPYAQHFRREGWIVDGMAYNISRFGACTDSFDRVWDIDWSRNPLSPQNFRKALPQICEIVAQGQYDLVHVHTPVAAFVTRCALRRLRLRRNVKVIYTAHGFHFYKGGPLLKNLAFGAMEKLAGAWTDYLVVINQEDEAAAHRYRLVPPQRVVYMPGIGVDLTRYDKQQVQGSAIAAVRAEMGLGEADRLFLAIAELAPRKRSLDILQAFAQLKHPNVHLAFAGSGPLQNMLQQAASDLQLQERVHFLGLRQDIATLIRASVATVLVSRQEGLPRSVMESLALEVPVIGTNIRGTRDLIQGDCGLLVEVGNINSIAIAMGRVLENPQEALAMGHRGRTQMETFGLQHTLALHQSLYSKALSSSLSRTS